MHVNHRWKGVSKSMFCTCKRRKEFVTATTTHAMTPYPIPSSTTSIQTTKSRRETSAMNLFDTGWGLWGRERNWCWGQLNLDRGYCYIFTLLYINFTSFLLQLPNHFVPRTYGYTRSHHYDSFPLLSLTHSLLLDMTHMFMTHSLAI